MLRLSGFIVNNRCAVNSAKKKFNWGKRLKRFLKYKRFFKPTYDRTSETPPIIVEKDFDSFVRRIGTKKKKRRAKKKKKLLISY